MIISEELEKTLATWKANGWEFEFETVKDDFFDGKAQNGDTVDDFYCTKLSDGSWKIELAEGWGKVWTIGTCR